jgi:nucleotide-binding universal stress UspA family protein
MATRVCFLSDTDEFSEKSLEQVSLQLGGMHTDFLLAHVVDSGLSGDLPSIVHATENVLIDMAMRILPKDLFYGVSVEAGDVLETLPALVREEGCSLVAIPGRPGETLIPLVRVLPVPQLLLRNEPGRPTDPLFSHLVIPIDLTFTRTYAILTQLRELLDSVGRPERITLLHCVRLEEPGTSQDLVNSASEAMERVLADVLTWDIPAESVILSGDPTVECPPKIAGLSPSLLVVGLSRMGDLLQVVLGSTGEALIEGTSCPALILPVN